LLYGDGRYADVFERSLYNGVLAGVSLDGARFFYVNPLESRGTHHRSGWFGCACCPPNVARTVAAVGGYAYAASDKALWVNLYIQGAAKVQVGAHSIALRVTTDYPWDGKIVLRPELERAAQFEMRLRVPGWCRQATVAVNGQKQSARRERGYIVLDRTWGTGDSVELELAMPVERVVANPRVKADAGQVALQRGPIVYCVEAADQSESLASLYLPLNSEIRAEREQGLLGGVVVLRGPAETINQPDWSRTLYQAAPEPKRVPIMAVPYYAWDNRTPGPMRVWLRTAPPAPPTTGLESRADVTLSFTSGNCQPSGIHDGVEPKSSGEQPEALCHWWPHKGSTEWAQYTWPKPVRVGGASVYWFDDTGRGECRLPASWRMEYLSGSAWKPVVAKAAYERLKDRWCETRFDPVTTTALRLVVELQPDWAAGVHEWKLLEIEDDAADLTASQ
jgi:hypothetical protein